MAFKLLARTREKTTTTGTGDIVVSGLVSTDNVLFSDGMSIGDTSYMCVVSGDGIAWEEFLGTYSSANTIARTTTLLNNSGTTAHINLSGTSRVFAIIPANLSSLFDQLFGSTEGTIIQRGAGGWEGIASSPTINGTLTVSNDGAGGGVDAFSYSTDATHPAEFVGSRARGTLGAPGAVLANDVLTSFLGLGFDGTDWHTAGEGTAGLIIEADENHTDSAHGTRVTLYVIPNGGTDQVLAFRVASDGGIIMPADITGGSQGVGTINADALYVGGVAVATSTDITPQNARQIAFSAPQTSAYTASQVVGHYKVPKAMTIPGNFASYSGFTSEAGGTANATGSTVFSVDKAAAASPNSFSQIGTITFGAGGVTPTFATASGADQSLAQGDVVRVVAPSSPDATFVGFYCTLIAHL